MNPAIVEGPIRLGIVGANPERGWAKDAHFPALATLPDYEVTAVSARTQEIADAAASTFGAKRAFGDSQALVQDPDIDVVVVTVKVPEHRAIVLAALENNKHVFCEWPLGRNTAEAEEMHAAAERAGTLTMIGLQGPQAPAARQAARLVQEGAIGRPLTLRVVSSSAGWGREAPPFYAYLQDKRNGATLSTIAGGHTLALMEAIAGAIVEVDARNSILRREVRVIGSEDTIERTCPDHVQVIGKHESGCVSSLELVGGDTAKPFVFELTGSDGELSISARHPGGYQVGNLTLEASVPLDKSLEPVSPGLKGAPANVAELYAHFATDLRSGSHSVPDFAAANRLTRLLAAIDTASDSGSRQTLGG